MIVTPNLHLFSSTVCYNRVVDCPVDVWFWPLLFSLFAYGHHVNFSLNLIRYRFSFCASFFLTNLRSRYFAQVFSDYSITFFCSWLFKATFFGRYLDYYFLFYLFCRAYSSSCYFAEVLIPRYFARNLLFIIFYLF